MATGEKDRQLTPEQIVRLAAATSTNSMEAIAEGYMGIDYDIIRNVRADNKDNSEAFNRDIIRHWSHRNRDNQIQNLARLLYRASDEGAYIDPTKIKRILGVSKEEAYFSQPTTTAYQVDRAYIEACKEGTKKVYNARMILAGYSEAGKTSLATRLLGGKINAHERRSTEGIALHHIESTFNTTEDETKGNEWGEKDLNILNLLSEFKYGVFERMEKYQRQTSDGSESPGEEYDLKHDDPKEHSSSSKDSTLVEKNAEKVSTLGEEYSEITNISLPSDEYKKEIWEMIPRQKSNKNTPFSISLWDLGGQDEFIATHHLFLNTEATIVIVMDITKGLHQLVGKEYVFGDINSVVESLDYWLNLFHTDAAKHNRTPNIAIVLTHIDKIPAHLNRNEEIKKYKDNIVERITDKPYQKYITANNIYAVDNTTKDYSVFQELRNHLLKHLSNQNTWGMDMPLTWFRLKAEIKTEAKRKRQKYLYLHEVWELGEKIGMDTDAVESFLRRQTVLGDLVYFPDLRDLVISEPQWLVDKCKDLITTHDFIDHRKDLPENLRLSLKKGQITEKGLKQLWKNDGVVFLIKLMEKFELLVDLSDKSCRKYIIPCMLPASETQIKQHGVPIKLLTDTFPQLVSKCSKLKNWKLSWDNLSYTTATFHIGKDVRLDLWLSSFREAQTRIWCSDDSDHTNTRSEIRGMLERLLEPGDSEITYGDKKLTDVMLWNLAKTLTTQSDVRTLAYALGVKRSEVDSCFTNYKHDINNTTHAVLTQWKLSEFSERVAYRKLCEALEKVQMNALIYQALVDRPV